MLRTNRENHIVMSFLSSHRLMILALLWAPTLVPHSAAHPRMALSHLACRCSEFSWLFSLSVPPPSPLLSCSLGGWRLPPAPRAGVMTRGPAACCLLHPHRLWPLLPACRLGAHRPVLLTPGALVAALLGSAGTSATSYHLSSHLTPPPPPPPPQHLFVFQSLSSYKSWEKSTLCFWEQIWLHGVRVTFSPSPTSVRYTPRPHCSSETAVPLVTNNIHLPNYLDIVQFIFAFVLHVELCDWLPAPACIPQILCDALHYKFCCHFGHTFEPAQKAKLDSTFGLVTVSLGRVASWRPSWLSPVCSSSTAVGVFVIPGFPSCVLDILLIKFLN